MGLRTVPTVSSPSVSLWQPVIEPEDLRQVPSAIALVDRRHTQKGDLSIAELRLGPYRLTIIEFQPLMILQGSNIPTFAVRNEAICCGTKNRPYSLLSLRQSLATSYRSGGPTSGAIWNGLGQPTTLKREISRLLSFDSDHTA